jgi:hypothetical protein
MQGLLSPAQRPSEGSRVRFDGAAATVAPPPTLNALNLPDSRLGALKDIQQTLAANGIETDLNGIAMALVDRLCMRPELCKALLANYLLSES